jgi:hypothetical protein
MESCPSVLVTKFNISALLKEDAKAVCSPSFGSGEKVFVKLLTN